MMDQEPTQTPSSPGETPEPQPMLVYDISAQHVFEGRVFKQFYVFLWGSVAFLVGAILPWRGDTAAPNFFQAVMIVASIGCVFNAWQSIRARRLTFWPILAVEFLAVFLLFLQYDHVTDVRDATIQMRREAAQARIDNPPAEVMGPAIVDYKNQISAEYNEWKATQDWNFMDIAFGAVTTFRSAGTPERKKFDAAWNSFGTGFHFSWFTTAFLFIFVVGSVVFAVITAKPKEDPKAARRRARSGGDGDKPAGGGDDAARAEKVDPPSGDAGA